MYIALICIIFVVIILIVKAYIKFKLGFWSQQPVFHNYNLLYYFSPPGVINPDLPNANKYIDHIHISTSGIQDDSSNVINENTKKKISCFLSSYYLKKRDIEYLPSISHIFIPLQNNNYESYVSLYEKSAFLLDNKMTGIVDKEIIGVITSRKVNIILLQKNKFPAYYVDNLCIHPAHRNKGVAPSLIQTHCYDTRYKTLDIKVHLFKREGQLTAIMPLAKYLTYIYDINKNINIDKITNIEPYNVSPVDKSNLHLAMEYIYSISHKYDCIVTPDLANILSCITNEVYHIYILVNIAGICGIYIFRDTCVLYNGSKTLELITSINSSENLIFVRGFLNALGQIKRKFDAKTIYIENIGDNYIINSSIASHYGKILKNLGTSPTAYFLYNYACNTIDSAKCLIIQ